MKGMTYVEYHERCQRRSWVDKDFKDMTKAERVKFVLCVAAGFACLAASMVTPAGW